MSDFDPNVVSVEWTEAVMRAMTRRRFGPLAAVLNDETITETAKDALAVMREVWPLVVAQVEQAQAESAKYHQWWIKARDERDAYAAELDVAR